MTDTTSQSWNHVELYKKYRPTRWNELIGQDRTARSLQSAVVRHRVPTAYGFFGPRGCGKTSSALLLAKSINCLHPQKDGNPCNECEICQNIDNGTQIGVSYLSMANNGGVDDIRDLVQKARLNSSVTRQVWILDEVHNLSKAAFDALLIPLEDAHMPSLFILCSTEADRIPNTVQSRIQSRRFMLVPEDIMIDHLHTICEKENIVVGEEALLGVVKRGRGSVRDTLSELEQFVEVGEAAPSDGGKLLKSISQKDTAAALEAIAVLCHDGYDGRDIAEELFINLRNLLLTVSHVDKELVGSVPVDNAIETARGFDKISHIISSIKILGDAITDMTIGADPRILLEVAVVNMIGRLRSS